MGTMYMESPKNSKLSSTSRLGGVSCGGWAKTALVTSV